MKILIALIVLTFGFSSAIKVDCEFKFVRNYQRSSFSRYKCYVKSIVFEDEESRKITSLTNHGYHPNQTDDTVTMIHSDKNIFKLFPRNFGSYFKNIEMLDIYESNLSELTNEDLRQFGSTLKILFFMRNQLKALFSDTFEHTPNLEWINLSDNSISHVDIGTFANLNRLNKLYFSNNPCHQGSAATNDALKILIAHIYEECKDLEVVRKESASLTEANQNIVDVNSQLTSNTTALLSTIAKRDQKIAELKEKKAKIEAENSKKIEELKLRKAELDRKCKEREEVLKSVQEMVDSMKVNMKAVCVPPTTTAAPTVKP